MTGALGDVLIGAWGALLAARMLPPLLELVPVWREMLARGWDGASPAAAPVFAGHAAVVLAAAAMVAALGLAGTALVRWFASRRAAELRWYASPPLGYGAVALFTLGLALVRLWFPILLALALVIPAAAVAVAGVPRWPVPRLGPRFPLIAFAAAVAVMAPWMLAPESQPDGWEYFLAGPERWLAGHGFGALAATPPLHYPNLAEMLYGLPVACSLDQIPKWLDAAMLLCGAAAAATAWRPGTEAWALLLFATSASGTFLMTTGKNEGCSAGFVLLAFATGWLARGQRRFGAAGVLGAVCGGLALGTKLMSVLNMAVLPVILYVLAGALRARAALAWGGLAVAVALPWYAKSWLMTGDPLYPVLAGYWPGLIDGWDHRNGELWRRCYTVEMPKILLPVRWLDGIAREQTALALLLPFVVLPSGPARGPGLAVLALFLVWYAAFNSPQTQRWGFPGFSPAFILAAGALPAWLGGSRIRRVAVAGCLGLGALHGLARLAYAPNPLSLTLGRETPNGYRARVITSRAGVDAYLSRSGTGRALILLGDTREYRLPKPVRVGSAHASGEPPLLWRLTAASRSERDMLIKFRQLNADRLLYNPMTAINNGAIFQPYGWTDAMLRRWREVFERWFELEVAADRSDHTNGLYYLYRLRRAPGPRPAQLLHLPGVEAVSADAMDIAGALPVEQVLYVAYLAEINRRVPRVLHFQDQAAFVARQEGHDEAAVALYQPGIRAGLIDDENLPGFGIVALHTGRTAEALGAFERTARIYPDWAVLMEDYAARARFVLAIRRMPQDPAEADRILSEGISILIEGPHAARQAGPIGLLRAARGYARFRLGRAAEAMADLNAAATVIPEVGTIPLPQLPGLLGQAVQEILTTTGNEQRLAAQRK